MNSIEQLCPQCSRMLELPAESTGKMAKCPACEATFRVGDDHPTTGTTAETTAGASFDAGSHTSEAQTRETAVHTGNPFGREPLTIVTRNIDEIASASKRIFLTRWKPSVLSCVIALAVSLLITGVMFGLAALAKAVAGNIGTMAVIMLSVPVGILASIYLLVGVGRVHLTIARNEASPISNLKPPQDVVLRGLVSYLALVIILFGLLAIGGLLVGVAAVFGNQAVASATGMLVTIVLSVVLMFMQWLMWAWIMVVSDGKATPIGALRVAYQITVQNKLTSFFVVLITIALSMIGSLACYVGHVVTTPATLVLFAVGYLMMTDQSVMAADDEPVK